MTEVVKTLNAAERASMSAQADKIASTDAPKLDTVSGKQFVFAAHFDGTNNNKDDLKLSGSKYSTNVAALHDQMLPQTENNPNFSSKYYKGVGTDPGLEGTLEGSIRPSADMRETALKAYNEFRQQATNWLKTHPDANPVESLKVMATGFSRGAGTAAVFSQILHERGLSDPVTGKVIVPPGQLGLAGALMFDPVTTGFDRNTAFSPESKNITVVQALNEYRTPFKGVNHGGHPNASVVSVTGNHCDIGGGYDNGIAARVLESSTAWMQKAGVPTAGVPPERRHDGTATVHHERDLPKTAEIGEASRSPWIRTLFPQGSRWVEGAARLADYPVTHDPRNGLDAPRHLTQSANEETLLPNGWKRFEAAEGTVWRKDFAQAHGATVKATMVEPYLKPGVDQRRLQVQLQSVRADGRSVEYPAFNADGKDPAATLRLLDQKMDMTVRSQGQMVGDERGTSLHPALQSLETQLNGRGYSTEQAHKITSYAQTQLDSHEMGNLKQAAMHKDGHSFALMFRDPPFKNIPILEALNGSEPREQAAANASVLNPALTVPAHAPMVAEARSR